MPDPTAYGITIPAAANGAWQVIGSSGPSAEYGAGGIVDLYNAIYMIIVGSSPGLNGTGTLSMSDT